MVRFDDHLLPANEFLPAPVKSSVGRPRGDYKTGLDLRRPLRALGWLKVIVYAGGWKDVTLRRF